MVILSPEEVRDAERAAAAGGLSFETMMRTAGNACADYILSHYPAGTPVVILAGKGKNAGDGFVCAARLAARRTPVSVILTLGQPTDPLARRMLEELDGAVAVLELAAHPAAARRRTADAGVLVDAVFGIGFRGRFPDGLREFIEEANALPAARIAVDLPSGVGSASEEPAPFRADTTLSMLCYKREQVEKPAAFYCGQTEILPIGFPPPDGPLRTLTKREAAAVLPPRPYDANKGTFGNVLILGGSRNMPGAAIMAAEGALHGGAGLVTLAVPDAVLPAAQAHLTAPVFRPLPTAPDGTLAPDEAQLASLLARASAVVLGNGMGVTETTKHLTAYVLKKSRCPVVLDADGINCAAENIDILKTAGCPVVLTPHPGEAARLLGTDVPAVQAAREAFAVKAAGLCAAALLKGANTLIAERDGTVYLNPTGCDALSRGGSGDTLAGLIGALLAQGVSPGRAAALGAYVHGLAGEIAAARYTAYAATTERITACIGAAFKSISEGSCR